MFSIRYTKEARLDITQAVGWYEQQQTGLGKKFLSSLSERTETISQMPHLFGVKSRKKYREAKLSKFPYLLTYKLYPRKKAILIVGLIHERRNTNFKNLGI